jgi:biopolymer transport protein ExbD
MLPKTRFRAGMFTLLAGIFLSLLCDILLVWRTSHWSRVYEIFIEIVGLSGTAFFFAGLLLIFSSAFHSIPSRVYVDRGLRLFPDMALRNVVRWTRHRPIPFITEPPIGIVGGTVALLLIVFQILISAPRSRGFKVELARHNSMPGEKSPWQESMSVYVAASEEYIVNGRRVSREKLRAVLEQELSHRLVRSVYLEADYDTLNINVMFAIDTIEGLGAQLIWITPTVRREIEQAKTQ